MAKSSTSTKARASIQELVYGIWKATVFKVALELDVFTIISKGASSLKDITDAGKSSVRGMSTLLDALCALGFLEKRNNQYWLTRISERYLVRGKDTFYGDWCLRSQMAWETRVKAAEAVQKGTAVGGDFSDVQTQDLWQQAYAGALVSWRQSAEAALEHWQMLGLDTKDGLRILDAAGGSGVKSFALAQTQKNIHVTVLDFPKMLDLTQRVAREMHVEKQATMIPGDILTADFGAEKYDVITFGAVLYFFNDEQLKSILTRAYTALRKKGRVVVNEPIADKDRCEHERALVVAFQLLLFLPHSKVRTLDDYNTIMQRCGFSQIIQHSTALISAVK